MKNTSFNKGAIVSVLLTPNTDNVKVKEWVTGVISQTSSNSESQLVTYSVNGETFTKFKNGNTEIKKM